MIHQEAAALQRKKVRGGGGGGKAGERRPERSPQQRYQSVEEHWRKLSAQQRRQLLSIPLQTLFAGERHVW